MFNFQSALQAWNGEHMSLADLQKRLSDLRLQHLGEIPHIFGQAGHRDSRRSERVDV